MESNAARSTLEVHTGDRFVPFLPSHLGIPEPSKTATTATNHSCMARVGGQLAEAALEVPMCPVSPEVPPALWDWLTISPPPHPSTPHLCLGGWAKPHPNLPSSCWSVSPLHYLSKRSPRPGTVQGAPKEPPGSLAPPPLGHRGAKMKRNLTIFQEHRR